MSNNYTFNSEGKFIDKNGIQLDTNSFPDSIVDPVSGNVLFSAKNGVADCGNYCTSRPVYEYILYLLILAAVLFGAYYVYDLYINTEGYLEKKIGGISGTYPERPNYKMPGCDKVCNAAKKTKHIVDLKNTLRDLKKPRPCPTAVAETFNHFGLDLKKLTKF